MTAPDARGADARARLVSGVAFLAVLAFAIAHYVMGAYLRRPYPATSFLLDPQDGLGASGQPSFAGHFWSSFWLTWRQSGSASPYLDTPAPSHSSYPPFAHVVMLVPGHVSYVRVLLAALVVLSVTVPLLVFRFTRLLDPLLRLRFALVMGASYPALFVLDSGNLEGLVVLVVVAFVVFSRDRPLLAAVLLGCAGALKGLPLVFVAAQLAERRFREAAVTLATSAVLTAASFAVFADGPVANARGFARALTAYSKGTVGDASLRHTSDLLGMVLTLGGIHAWTVPLARHSALLTALSLSAVVAYVLLVRPAAANAVCLLSIALVLGVHPAVDYRLLYLLVPVVLFVRQGWPAGDDRVVGLAWGLALAPLSLPLLPGDIGLGAVLRPLLLLGLVVLLVRADIRYLRDRRSARADVTLLTPEPGPSAVVASRDLAAS